MDDRRHWSRECEVVCSRRLHPAKLFQAEAVIPDLRHVLDPIAISQASKKGGHFPGTRS
jgi:hypothetical protein